MSGSTDQELSPAAAHRILRSIAYWDWTILDQAASGLANRLPVIADAPVREEVLDYIEYDVNGLEDDVNGIEDHVRDVEDDVRDVEDDFEESPSPTFRLCKRPGGWYLNEVPEELLDECEKELWTEPLIDLRQVLGLGYDGGAEETSRQGSSDGRTEGLSRWE